MSRLPPEFPTPVDETSAPFRNLHFLVIDDNPDGRFLVSKTLLRKFPNSAVVEAQTSEAAFRLLASVPISLIVSHRTFEHDTLTLVTEIRRRNPSVPLVVMSGIDRSAAAKAVGASAFLTYDEWLMVGNHVASLLLKPTGAHGRLETAGEVLER